MDDIQRQDTKKAKKRRRRRDHGTGGIRLKNGSWHLQYAWIISARSSALLHFDRRSAADGHMLRTFSEV